MSIDPYVNSGVLRRFFTGMYWRSRALEHIPGPQPANWCLGFMELAYTQQPHRLCTALSEEFGPIWKFRMLCFHVSLILSHVYLICVNLCLLAIV